MGLSEKKCLLLKISRCFEFGVKVIVLILRKLPYIFFKRASTQLKHCNHIVLILLLGIFSGCRETKNTEQIDNIRPVKLFQIKESDQEQIRHFPGRVSTSNEVAMSFKISGELTDILVVESQSVEQGQILAQIDTIDIKNELKTIQANYELALLDFERNRSLLNKKIIAKSQFEESNSRLKSARSELDTAKAKLDYAIIQAPFDGRVARIEVDNHQYIEAKQTILYLQSDNALDIHIEVPENLISQIDTKEMDLSYKPYAIFPAIPGKHFPLDYKSHSTMVTPGTQTYSVLLSMDLPYELVILPGMTAIVVVDMAKIFKRSTMNNHFLVPLTSIMKDDATGNSIVWGFDRNRSVVNPIKITLGQITDQGVEITGKLRPDDEIVAAGVNHLRAGMKVKPLRWERGL